MAAADEVKLATKEITVCKQSTEDGKSGISGV
jgi:hypothetical protein